MRDLWLLLAAVILIVFAVVGLILVSAPRQHNTYREASYSSPGERIYYAGVGKGERFIPFTDEPHWLATMRPRGCVNCHGVDGRGGFPMMMTSMVAPDITYASLTSEEHYHGGQHESHEGRYTDEAIKRAITQGIEPSGKKLNVIMPRWKMTDEELNELLAYLKEI